MSRTAGFEVEKKACNYLISHGLKLVERNYHCRLGEIDLIMLDKGCLVFIEVRARKSSAFGGALASVTPSKQRKLIRTASYYLLTKHRGGDYPARFDVVSFDGIPPEINWVKHAFGADV